MQYVTFELRDSGGNVVDFAEDFEAPFSVSMTTYLDGTHIVSATATDANGLSLGTGDRPSDRGDTRTGSAGREIRSTRRTDPHVSGGSRPIELLGARTED